MTQKHTPEPWAVSPGDNISSPGIDGPNGEAVVWWTSSQHDEGIPNHADAYRIAAAVNACKGIPTEDLEAGVVADMLEALKRLEASVRILPPDMDEPDSPLTQARAAIARATGEAKP